MIDTKRTKLDIDKLNLNDKTVHEFNSVQGGTKTVVNCIEKHLDTLRYNTGRKLRKERRDSMLEIYKVLIQFVTKNRSNACAPSMRTIACAINNKLEKIEESDPPWERERKERTMAPILMYVQRTIKSLEKFGLIRIYAYRSETNRNDDPDNINLKHPNYYYEIIQVSTFCSAFAALLTKVKDTIKETVKETANKLKDTILNITKAVFSNMGYEDPNDIKVIYKKKYEKAMSGYEYAMKYATKHKALLNSGG